MWLVVSRLSNSMKNLRNELTSLLIGLVVLTQLGCKDAPATPEPAATSTTAVSSATAVSSKNGPEPPGDAKRGRELAEKFECQRCHEVPELPEIKYTSHCTTCHQRVLDGQFKHKKESARWRKNVKHLNVVPSLAAIGKRFHYTWIVRFLLNPYDLRPNLVPTMPRLALEPQQARDIATWLVETTRGKLKDDAAKSKQLLAKTDLKAGRKVIEEKECGSCHLYGGVAALPNKDPAPKGTLIETRPAVMLATNLRHARDQTSPALLVPWLANPLKLKENTLMPETPMTETETRNIIAYIMTAKISPEPKYVMPKRLEPLKRRVTYDEVAKKMLNITCRHCHGDPDVALGDGGPGNTGGFGFPERGVNLTSYQEVQSGRLDDKGERESMFIKMKDGTPRFIASLWARHSERAGKPNPDMRGMPLGLPPLPAEAIQLVETWVAQGRPR